MQSEPSVYCLSGASIQEAGSGCVQYMILLHGFARDRKGLMEETPGEVSEVCVFRNNNLQVSASVIYTNGLTVCLQAIFLHLNI